MSAKVRFRPQLMAADSSYTLGGETLGGFVCTVSGTLTVTDRNGTVVVNALPVTAGQFHELPFVFDEPGCVISLASGAAGTLAV